MILIRSIAATVILFALFGTGACSRADSTPRERSSDEGGRDVSAQTSTAYESPRKLADLEDRQVKESSGIVASRRNPDVFWTHNDSGNGPFIYAFDRKGTNLGRWRVTSASAADWEDIAAGPGPEPGTSYLYIGDIGDNDRDRDLLTVYRLIEPTVSATQSSEQDTPAMTEPAEAIRLRYPDGGHDAETLLVHPLTGDLYVITKSFNTAAGVYKLATPYSTSSLNSLVRIGSLDVPSLTRGMLTGGDISPDGKRVVLCDYLSGYEIVLPENSNDRFDSIWKQEMEVVQLGQRRQGEAVCYRLDGKAILATSEKRPVPLIEVTRK